MIHHHPDNNMLLEYASGSLNWAHSIVVSAHLQMCPKCTADLKLLNGIGGNLLAGCTPAQSSAPDEEKQSFDQLMRRIDAEDEELSSNAQAEQAEVKAKDTPLPRKLAKDPVFESIPPVVGKLLSGNPVLRWRRLSRGLKEARLKTGQSHHEVAFHRIAPGSKVAEHDHRGKEITLVLYGSFSDADGVYSPGDFLVREPGETHRPTATQDQECLCLSVVEAPVALTGLMGKLVNPFLSIRPQ